MDDEEASLQGYVFVDAEDVSGGTSNSSNATNIPNNNLVNIEDFDVCQMAKDVYNLGFDADMSSEELELIRTSTVNTKKYEKSKNGIEERFFDTIEKYGGVHLKPLTLYAADGYCTERLFYIKLRGERTEDKRYILNKCLVKIALKWRNASTGKHLQPSTWETKMKYLFAVFRNKNVNYNYATDFNGVGEFHAVLTSQWDKERSLDPSFASGVKTSTFDMDADYKIREFYREGKFNPLSKDITETAFDDRMKYTVFVLGRYFLMRGKNEIAFCQWDQIKFHSDIVNGTAEEFVEVLHHWDKTNKCKLKSTKPRDLTKVAPRIYANPNDELCPYNCLKFLRGLCAPSQERVLCYAANDEDLKEFVAGRHPYLYNPKLPVGGNKIGPLCKKMAREMGFTDWEKCTGHGLRKM